MRVSLICMALVLGCVLSCDGEVLEKEAPTGCVPERCGLGIVLVNTYKPGNDIQSVQISGFAVMTPETIWPHISIESLRYKIGCHAGVTTRPRTRCMVSGGLILLYYLGDLGSFHLRPYLEGGCHIIYDDFQVPGQGLRVNFNPQVGIGMEFEVGSEQSFYMAFRLQHISNGSLHPDNAGINSFAVTVGRLF